jgi:hypothetical protein
MTFFSDNTDSIRKDLAELETHIVLYDKDKVPDYKFIKTVDAGGKNGHILYGKHSYWLCLRSTEQVSINDLDGYVFGFQRKTLEEVEMLAETLNESYNCEQAEENGEVRQTVNVKPTDKQSWIEQASNLEMIHTKSGVVFSLCQSKQNLVDLFGLSAFNIVQLLRGETIKDFVLYNNRIDGVRWRDFVDKPIRTAKTKTQNGWGCKVDDKFHHYNNFVLQKGIATIQVCQSDDPCVVLRTNKKQVRDFFRNGADGIICGWTLATR